MEIWQTSSVYHYLQENLLMFGPHKKKNRKTLNLIEKIIIILLLTREAFFVISRYFYLVRKGKI